MHATWRAYLNKICIEVQPLSHFFPPPMRYRLHLCYIHVLYRSIQIYRSIYTLFEDMNSVHFQCASEMNKTFQRKLSEHVCLWADQSISRIESAGSSHTLLQLLSHHRMRALLIVCLWEHFKVFERVGEKTRKGNGYSCVTGAVGIWNVKKETIRSRI